MLEATNEEEDEDNYGQMSMAKKTTVTRKQSSNKQSKAEKSLKKNAKGD